MVNNSVKKCCVCNNEKMGEFITINDNKYHLCCIENLHQENEELRQAKYELILDSNGLINANGILQQENKELHNKIDNAIEILKEHFVEEYIRSCDTSDGVGRCEIDTEHWTYKAYEILKESDLDECE